MDSNNYNDDDKGEKTDQDRSVVRFLRIDPMVSGSNPPSAKLSLRVRRVIRRINKRGVVTSRQRTWTLLDKQKASHCVQISTFDIYIELYSICKKKEIFEP